MMDCITDVKLGEKCTTSEECVADDTICKEGICQCKTDYIKSKNGERCLKGNNSYFS